MILSFANVNEDGAIYATHSTIEPALEILREFPNDTVVISVVSFEDEE